MEYEAYKKMLEDINRMNKEMKYSGGEKITLWIVSILITLAVIFSVM